MSACRAAVVLLLPMLAASCAAPAPTEVSSKVFIEAASKTLHWEEPTEPVKIAGPVHWVGTRGLGAYLIATGEGCVLLNTGMPHSGPMIVASIRKLGFQPTDVKLLIICHAHLDHCGALAYMKEVTGAKVAVMKLDAQALSDGGRSDFHYGKDLAVMGFPPCPVDRTLADGEIIRMGDVTLTAVHTPGHTRGCTTWTADFTVEGRPLKVVWGDGAGINPGYRLLKDPSYPGIADDYRRTLHRLEMLKPDIFLQGHAEAFGFAEKRARAVGEGVSAWINPEEYRRWVAGKRRAFEDRLDREMLPTEK